MPDPIAASYDRWSANYDSIHNPTRDLDALILREHGPAVDGRDVLELGCGTGKNTVWLAERASSLVAMDFSEGMLDAARRRLEGRAVRWVRQDIREHWPLDDGSVDVAVGNLVLEHVEDLTPVFAEAVRVLRPGGELYLAELHPYRQWRGGQAHFEDAGTGEIVHVPAYVHTVGAFANGGLAAGLRLLHLGEWLEADAPAGSLPRLLTVRFTLQGRG